MAYDEGLAERIRGALEGEGGIIEKKMFGGIAGKPMAGYVFVGPKGTSEDDALDAWVRRALKFNQTLRADKKSRRRPVRSGL